MRERILNNHGTSMIMPIIMAGLTLSAFGIIGMMSVYNQNASIQLDRRAAKKYVLRELRTVLADPGICLNIMTVNHANNTFQFNGVLANGQQVSTLRGSLINRLYISNLTNVAGNIWEADFNVRFTFPNALPIFSVDPEISTRVRYTLQANGTVSQCGLSVSNFDACQQLGLIWDPATQQCDICTSMNGQLVNGVCQL